MKEEKIAFWSLIFLFYIGMFWILPIWVEPETAYLVTVLICHGIISAILGFAFLAGYLFDKAYL